MVQLVENFSRGLFLAPCFALLLAGCGGSSGGGGSSNPTPTVVITRANAGQVATAAYGGNDGMGEVVQIPGTILSADGPDALQITGLAGLAWHTLRRSVLGAKHLVTPAGVDDPCPGGGTAVETFADPNGNDQLDAGESGDIVFTNCMDMDGTTINGTMTFTLDMANENEVVFTLKFDDLTIVGGPDDDDWLANGSLTFGLASIDDPPTLILTLSGEDLEFVENGEPLELAGDFDFTLTLVLGNDPTVTFTMTLDIPTLGVIDVSTTGLVGEPPQSGVVLVEGASGTITLTMIGGGAVTVTLDEDGDGNPECSQDLTLETLDQFDPLIACA